MAGEGLESLVGLQVEGGFVKSCLPSPSREIRHILRSKAVGELFLLGTILPIEYRRRYPMWSIE